MISTVFMERRAEQLYRERKYFLAEYLQDQIMYTILTSHLEGVI